MKFVDFQLWTDLNFRNNKSQQSVSKRPIGHSPNPGFKLSFVQWSRTHPNAIVRVSIALRSFKQLLIVSLEDSHEAIVRFRAQKLLFSTTAFVRLGASQQNPHSVLVFLLEDKKTRANLDPQFFLWFSPPKRFKNSFWTKNVFRSKIYILVFWLFGDSK